MTKNIVGLSMLIVRTFYLAQPSFVSMSVRNSHFRNHSLIFTETLQLIRTQKIKQCPSTLVRLLKNPDLAILTQKIKKSAILAQNDKN